MSRRGTDRRRAALSILVASCAAIVLVWKVPQWQLAPWRAGLTPRDFLDLENELRQTAVFVVALAALLAGLVLLWRRSVASARAAERSLEVAQQARRADRLSKAIGDLGSDKLEARVGAIYLLERLTRESPEDHRLIVEVMCAYVRERSAWSPERPPPAQVAADIQATLSVLGRRPAASDDGDAPRIDLRQTDLRGADLRALELQGACLRAAHLEQADLQAARLEGADLRGAYLGGADLAQAALQGADLREAHLEGTYLVDVDLGDANLGGAFLDGAYLGGANLEGANLGGAHLDGAYTYNTRLEGASLDGAGTAVRSPGDSTEQAQIAASGSEGRAETQGRTWESE